MSGTLPAGSAGHDTVPAVPADAQRLRAEIERTREDLGATVEQLAAKLDVKSRARVEAAELAGRIKGTGAQIRLAAPGYAKRVIAQGTRIGREQRVPLSVAAGAGVLAVASLVIWRRRR